MGEVMDQVEQASGICRECEIVRGYRPVLDYVKLCERHAAIVPNWQPIETCPDNTTVLFWDNGPRIGRMEHDTQRLGGFRQDHFWGDLFDDDRPPTHWMPLPAPPETDK